MINDADQGQQEITTDLERRKKFLRYLNRGWLALGIVTLLTLPLFPKLRGEFIFLIAVTFPVYLIVRSLNLSGRTQLAGVIFTLCVNFSFFGLFMVLVDQLGANEAFQTQATVWMLMGLAVLFGGAFVNKWAALGLAAFNTFLLIGTRLLIAPGSEPRPSVLVFLWMLALTSWLYEQTLNQALAQVLNELKERRRTEEEIRRRVQTMTVLYETTHDLVVEHDLSKLLQTIVERAVRLLNAEGGGLYLCEPELGQVRCVVSYHTPRDFTGTVLKYGEGAAGWVAQSAGPLIIYDYNTWEGRAKIFENEKPFSAVLSVPMKWQNEMLGVIHVLEFQKERHFTEDDQKLVASFANQAAIAVQNARLYSLTQQELIERKEVEAALLESEQRFRGLSEAAFEGILIHDKGIIQDANQAFADLVGYHSPEDLIGKNGLETLPLAPESLESLRKNIGSGSTEPLEITVIRLDGSTYPAETQGRDITFKGRKLRVVAMRDITERKQAEETLRKLSRAVEQSPASIVITSRTGEIEYVNPKFTQVTGYTLEEALGNNSRILKSGHTTQEEYKRMWNTITAGQEWQGEFRNRKKNGDLYWEYAVISSISNDRGEITHFIAVKEDITERKQAEDERRASEKRYRSLFENMLEGYAYCKMLFVDNEAQDFIYLDVNPAFQTLTGLKNIIGQRVSQVIPGIRESNPELFEIYGRVALTGQLERFETYVPALNIWFSISVFCPEHEHFVSVFDNITERKHFEEAQRKLNTELEARVMQRTVQFETANKELDAFSYSVSHDLRTPLRAINGYARILEEEYASQLPAEAQHYIDNILDSSKHMGQLINDLLTLSRVTRQVIKRETVNLSNLAQAITAELGKDSPRRSVEFFIAKGLDANGDPGLLQIVLENLLNNAWKYTSKRAQARIEFGAVLQPDGSHAFFVRDNGAGFDMAYADKLFGAFQRLHTESDFEGTGIGLATVQRIIQRHGGRIWAEAEVDKGATFYFTL